MRCLRVANSDHGSKWFRSRDNGLDETGTMDIVYSVTQLQ